MSHDGLAVTAAASKQVQLTEAATDKKLSLMARPLRPAVEQNIRIWIITATQLQSAAADHWAGYACGLLRLLAVTTRD
jgi:hypothetical protein